MTMWSWCLVAIVKRGGEKLLVEDDNVVLWNMNIRQPTQKRKVAILEPRSTKANLLQIKEDALFTIMTQSCLAYTTCINSSLDITHTRLAMPSMSVQIFDFWDGRPVESINLTYVHSMLVQNTVIQSMQPKR